MPVPGAAAGLVKGTVGRAGGLGHGGEVGFAGGQRGVGVRRYSLSGAAAALHGDIYGRVGVIVKVGAVLPDSLGERVELHYRARRVFSRGVRSAGRGLREAAAGKAERGQEQT